MDSTDDDIRFLLPRKSLMLDQLREFCNINSASDNLAGLALMQEKIASYFEPIADSIEIHAHAPLSRLNMQGEKNLIAFGKTLLIRKRPQIKRRVLLVGHMDTVHAATGSFQAMIPLNETQYSGPGVTDMKGGIIVMLHALHAFEQSPLASQLGWDVFINADEEISSLGSQALLAEIAPSYQAALIYEPALDIQGALAKGRKGSGKVTLVATGKSAHAGRDFSEGRNAICYLAEILLAINALNGNRLGLTINVGKIAGGEALNQVPDKAVAQLDIRFSKEDDATFFKERLTEIMQEFAREGFNLIIESGFYRPVKPISQATQKLFTLCCDVGKQIGLTLEWRDSGGCCDGNNLAAYGVPVLDTLGVRGSKIHTHEESIEIDSLVERAVLTTKLLSQLAAGGLEAIHV